MYFRGMTGGGQTILPVSCPVFLTFLIEGIMGEGMSGYENREHKEAIKASEVGSLEDVLGKDDSLFQPDPKDLTGSQEDLVGHQDLTNHELHVAENEAEGENTVTENMKDIPVEVEIEYLKNMETGNIFPVNETIINQKLLKPCDKDGKLVYDNRIFNGMR